MNQVPVPNQAMAGLPPPVNQNQPSMSQNRPPMQQYSQVTSFLSMECESIIFT